MGATRYTRTYINLLESAVGILLLFLHLNMVCDILIQRGNSLPFDQEENVEKTGRKM